MHQHNYVSITNYNLEELLQIKKKTCQRRKLKNEKKFAFVLYRRGFTKTLSLLSKIEMFPSREETFQFKITGKPISVLTTEIIDAVYNLLLSDRRIKINLDMKLISTK